MFETRIKEFSAAIERTAVGKGLYAILYLFSTILLLAIGIPVTKAKVDYDGYESWWFIYFSISMMDISYRDVYSLGNLYTKPENCMYLLFHFSFHYSFNNESLCIIL